MLARMVFFQAHLWKKKRRSATTWCPPIKCLSLFLCVQRKTNWKQKAMKNKDKAWTTLESHYAGKRPGKNIPNSKNVTIFNRWQKWPFCKGYSKAKWSQMVTNGLYWHWSSKYQKHTGAYGKPGNPESYARLSRPSYTGWHLKYKIEKRTWRAFRNDYFFLIKWANLKVLVIVARSLRVHSIGLSPE